MNHFEGRHVLTRSPGSDGTVLAACTCGWEAIEASRKKASGRFSDHLSEIASARRGERRRLGGPGGTRGVAEVPNTPLHKMTAR